MSTIKILVATNKECQLPQSDIFLPIQVGRKIAEVKLDMQGDDEGENISEKNPSYCELTAQYWAWKNFKHQDYIGLCHYRRYFRINDKSILKRNKYLIQISSLSCTGIEISKLESLLSTYDIITVKPDVYPYDLHFDYCYNHIKDDYKILNSIIKDKYPEYINSFNYIFNKQNLLSHYNMLITSNQIFCEYSEWIFDILNEVEKHIKISEYSIQKRVFGYMSERLLNVYIHHNNLKSKQLPIYFITEQKEKQETYFYYLLRNIRNKILFRLSKLGTK